ncbi:hypothetical protein KY313_01765 [Candidatus Woesearchaeota archaeon]|nr:hypothetical protein [Candidatus Woesearchaeota archaeon]
MQHIMPQEIEVWYLIPALRKELSRIFIRDYGLAQKKAAELLGISEAAVSQYVKEKRGKEIKFTKSELGEIKDTAAKIVKDKKHSMKYLYEACVTFRGSKTICNLHRKYHKDIPAKCTICVEG